MQIKPVISGIGLVTPLGSNAPETWAALLAGRFISDHAKLPLEFDPNLPRVSRLAIRAAREAAGDLDLSEAALVVGTSKGPVEEWLTPALPQRDPGGTGVSPVRNDAEKELLGFVDFLRHSDSCTAETAVPQASIETEQLIPPFRSSENAGSVQLGLASVAADVAAEMSIGGPRLTLSAACASGLHALIRGAMLIESGEFRRVLVIGCEASVCPLFIASFQRLGVLPPAGFGCRPFDRARAGFLMSEAAAAVLLSADGPGMGIGIDHFAIGADATHLTGMDPQGRVLRRVLASSLNGSPVDLIHAHGTGTTLNDEIELAAMGDLVEGSAPPSLYSHKGALGHSLGAAGLVSVVLNVISHQTGIVLPNVRTKDPLPTRLTIEQSPVRRKITRSLAVAAGFGGAIAAVTLCELPEGEGGRGTAASRNAGASA